MISKIELHNLLPLVFRGMEDSSQIRGSQIWTVPSVVFEKGCKICVHSESGGGKSSLLSFIYGNRSDYQGNILFDGHDVRAFGVDRWCQLRVSALALLPQEMRLFPELSVIQNISLKNDQTACKTPAQIDDMLQRLGIAGKKETLAGSLSIGQQQRVAIIRTVCQPFDFVFLDEPVSHLDQANNRIVAQIIEEEAASQGAGIVSTSVGNHLMLTNPKFISL